MLNMNSIMIGTTQLPVMAEFYKFLLGKPEYKETGWYGWQAGDTHISLGSHSEAKGKSKDPVRVMMNFETDKVKEEFARIKAIKGATVIKEPYEIQGMWIATFADPDGNYMQLMSPWVDPK